MSQVCLVSMPFAALERPSLALGLLQARLEEAGLSCRSLYPNLEWSPRVGGPDRYVLWEEVLGDLAFSGGLFPDHHPDLRPYLRQRLAPRRNRGRLAGLPEGLEDLVEEALEVRREAARFVGELALRALETGATIFGCTSLYWQHAASLALLREIRRLDPEALTMLGGANCEGVMGRATHRHFPWVDFVVSGEADDFFVPWCQELLRSGRDLEALPHGVLGPRHRLLGYPGGVPRASCRDLDANPTPQYRDYFEALRTSELAQVIRPGLPLETARGCWWGQSHQCLFCGISPEGLRYHSKSPARVLQEMADLEERHHLADFEVADNILDMAYFRTVLPELAARPSARRIFWEVKANLKRPQVALLARAGVTWVQPGLEALHSRVLDLVGKGVHAGQNVLLLKWCREHGLAVSWNLLWGFPGEEDSWYAETAALVPLLVHLPPPRGMIRLRLDRFSPYQSRPREFGLRLKPARYLPLAYDLPQDDLEELAYFFELAEPAPPPGGPGLRSLGEAAARWRQRFWSPLPPVLALEDDGESLRVLDTRRAPKTLRLEGELRATSLRAEEGLPRSEAGPRQAVDELVALGLLLELDGRVLGLAVRGPLPSTPRWPDFPGGHVDLPEVRRRRARG